MLHVSLVHPWPKINSTTSKRLENITVILTIGLPVKVITQEEKSVVMHVIKYLWSTHSENSLIALLSASLSAVLQSDYYNKYALW